MHNLHFVVTRAESPEDACSNVETFIEDFGNENNWKTVCGCVSEDNEVFINDSSGRYSPEDTGYTTIEKIKEVVGKWTGSDTDFYSKTAAQKLAKGETDLTKWESSELYSLQRLAQHLYETLPIRKQGGFDLFKDSYFGFQYDECGITQMEEEIEGEGKFYVVFVDMHS